MSGLFFIKKRHNRTGTKREESRSIKIDLAEKKVQKTYALSKMPTPKLSKTIKDHTLI